MNKTKVTTAEAQEILASLNEIKANTKMSAIASKKMLTVDEVVMLTGLSVAYIYKLTHNRQIPFYKPLGKVLYFDRSEIEEWMRQNRQQTTEETEQEALKRLASMNRKK